MKQSMRSRMRSPAVRLPAMPPLRWPRGRVARLAGAGVVAVAGLAAVGWAVLPAIASGPLLAISQVPLTLTTPARPRVLLALGNTQSMDATLGGAMMVGSGALSSDLLSLVDSSSPANYTVPAGFTPPLKAANASGVAPYTVAASGVLQDNSASRMNIAKAGLQMVLQSYLGGTDFGLATYSAASPALSTTWAYYTAPDSGAFAFATSAQTGLRYVNNPCHVYSGSTTTVASNCSAIASTGLFSPNSVSGGTLMQVGATSDDPAISAVFYGRSLPGVFVDYGVPGPKPTPFPPDYEIGDYNVGNITLQYPSSLPDTPTTSMRSMRPAASGYTPSAPQLMFSARGFGYVGTLSPSSGSVVVPMTALGVTPAAADVTTALNTFTPFLQPETNDPTTTEVKSAAMLAPVAGLLTRAKSYFDSLAPPANNGCASPQVVVLVTDGQPTMDLSGQRWPPVGSAAANAYRVTASFNSDGSLASTNSQALNDTIGALKTLHDAGVKTYIIGLGAATDGNVNAQAAAVLRAMAIAGGSTAYYPATSPSTLVDALSSVLVTVQNASLTTTAAAVSASSLQAGTVQYQASFTSADTPYGDWTGDLVATPLDPQTGAPTGTPLWSAKTQLDAQATNGSRLIATWNPSLNAGSGRGVPFQWTNGDPSLAISVDQQSELQPAADDASGLNRLLYLRGNSSGEVRNGGSFRNRSHILGDIVDSQAAYVGVPAGPYYTSSYLQFRQTQASRPPMLYVGANDGMLHAFDARTGNEQFAFVPNGVFANLYPLTSPLYNQHHQFFVDGSPQSGDVLFSDGSWHTLVVGGLGGGGRSVYALDVTNPQSLTDETAVAAAVKWEFSDADDLGLTYSVPQIAPVAAAPGFAVFFGNGYNSTNNHAVLYAVNPQTGAQIAKIDFCTVVPAACAAGAPQGLSTVAVGNADGLQGQPITQVYAGDLQGNLWAVDVSAASPSAWQARLLFQARDPSGTAQPITTAPVVTLNPNYPRQQGLFVMFGTGSLLTPSDLANRQTQSIYGVWDKPGAGQVYSRDNLVQQTLTLVTAATSGLSQDILTDTSAAVNLALKFGWYADLPVAGQRVMSDPLLLNGTFITTLNLPPSTGCSTAGTPMLLEVNYATGGAFPLPQLDLNGNLVIDGGDLYNGQAPVGIGLGSSRSGAFASAPTVRGPNAKNQMVKSIALSTGEQVNVINPNNGARSASWWQIQ